MIIYRGRRNLQFHSPIVAPHSHFNAQSTVAMVKRCPAPAEMAVGEGTSPFHLLLVAVWPVYRQNCCVGASSEE